jgi:hypothetical protein
MITTMTPAERRRRRIVRRILRLHRDGKRPAEIAADPKVNRTARRVRQILNAFGLTPNGPGRPP